MKIKIINWWNLEVITNKPVLNMEDILKDGKITICDVVIDGRGVGSVTWNGKELIIEGMKDMSADIRVRKVKMLKGRVREEAEKKGLKPNDLVIITTTIDIDLLPEYQIEKIEGDPVSYLLRRSSNEKVRNMIERDLLEECNKLQMCDKCKTKLYFFLKSALDYLREKYPTMKADDLDLMIMQLVDTFGVGNTYDVYCKFHNTEISSLYTTKEEGS